MGINFSSGSNLACISQATNNAFAATSGFTPVMISNSGRSDYQACNNVCKGQGYLYSGAQLLYSDTDTSNFLGVECFCYNSIIASSDVLSASDSDTANFCAEGDVAYSKTTTTFSTVKCYIAPPDTSSFTTVNSYADCFQQCSGFRQANIIPSVTEDGFQCSCEAQTSLEDAYCAPGVNYLFAHDNFPANSGVARRSKLALAAEKRAKDRLAPGGDMEFCPAGLTACRVAKSDLDGYECIDTNEELESCGGCPWGTFGTQAHHQSSFGVDCSLIPGTTLGGSTCYKGVCVASYCEEEYTLVEGECLLI